MKQIKSIISCVLLALVAALSSSVQAETYDFTASWWTNLAGTVSIGKSFSFVMPEEGECYYKISGVSIGKEYSFFACGADVYIEVLYKYSYKDEYRDTYIESATLGSLDNLGDCLLACYVDEGNWDDDIMIDPTGQTSNPVSPTGYYLCVVGNPGETIVVSSSGGLVDPPKTGMLTVTIKGADATWSLKSGKASYTNGQTVAIMGQQTVTFPAVKGLTKPADITVEPSADGEEIVKTGVYGVALTLRGTDVSAEYEGELHDAPCSFTVIPGEAVKLDAPAECTDTRGNACLFQAWTPSKTFDFGAKYSAASNETTIEMPSAALTMTATYLKKSEAAWMTIHAEADPVTIGEKEVKPEAGDLLWSPDGKTWYASGTKVLVKNGSYTLKWKSQSGTWDGPTAKTTVKLAAGDEYDNEENPAKFTFVTIMTVEPVLYENGELTESAEGGTATIAPASGRINATATSVTLTAKPNKNYVFVGWAAETWWKEFGLAAASGDKTMKSTWTSDMLADILDEEDCKAHYLAVFRSVSDYLPSGVTNLFTDVWTGSRDVTPTYDKGGLKGTVEFTAGLYCPTYIYLGCSAEAKPLTFKLASGTLPPGMKFDAKVGYVTGTPTKGGTYEFSVTATDPAGHACTLAISLEVTPVFDSIAGNYRALLKNESGAYEGLFEMSVTDKGKASAKVITATGTTSVTPYVNWLEDLENPDSDGQFLLSYNKVTGNAKSGSSVDLWFYISTGPADATSSRVTLCDMTYFSSTWKNGVTNSVSLSGTPAYSDPSILADEDFADTFLGKYYTVQLSASSVDATPSSRQSASPVDATPSSRQSDSADDYRTPTELIAPGYLTLTTDKKGAVKVAGKLADGTAVSASTVLLTSTNASTASVQLFVVPSSYKKKGSVALQLDLSPVDATPSSRLSASASPVDATPSSRLSAITSSLGSWTTPPLLDAIANHDPAEDDAALFLPGRLALAASGAEYSKLADLTDYYLSLCVTTNAVSPTLEYSYTDADKAKQYARANLALGSYTLGDDMLTGGTGGKITVAKSPSPWKDSDGVWHYDESKPDKTGATQAITNPGSLTISFAPATGIFTGKCNLFFDYEVPQYKNGEEIASKKEHKSVSCAYAGVVVLPIDDESETIGLASAVYAGKYTYEYETADARGNVKSATKTYTQNCALPVTWTLGE